MSNEGNIMNNIATAEVNVIQQSQSNPEYNIIRYLNGTFDVHKSIKIVSHFDPIPIHIIDMLLMENEPEIHSSSVVNTLRNIDHQHPQSDFLLKPKLINLSKKDSLKEKILLKSFYFNKSQSPHISISSKDQIIVSHDRKYFCWLYNCDIIYLEKFENLITELITIKSLRHENIIKLHEIICIQSMLLVYTPFYSMGTCESALKYIFNSGMDYMPTIYVIKCVVDAINYLHGHHILHRSIRCRNILISEDGRVALCDFGSIYYLNNFYNPFGCGQLNIYDNSVHNLPDNMQECISWIAPEVLKQNIDGYSFASDIYSIGITLLELLFAVPPYHNILPLKAFKAKLCQENSLAAKAICIFTNKYFSKKNAILFFQRIFDQYDEYNDDNYINDKNSIPNDIDYGYAKVFTRYSHKANSFKYKLYKLVSNMLQSDPTKRMTAEQILNSPIMKKVPNKMRFKKLKK